MIRDGGRGRTALVLGATGGVGGEIAAALLAHGWHVRALARDPAKAARSARRALARAEWAGGDAMRREDVARTAPGADLIVHAVNPAGYKDWDKLVLPMIDNSISAAVAVGARIALPGTIYNYGLDAFPVLHTYSPQSPFSDKGRFRVEIEKRLEAASRVGAGALIVRAGDFFGPYPGNNWFSQGMVKPGKAVKAITYPGADGIGHSWAYLPDLGETFACLADRSHDLPPFARYHFEGYWDADGTGMIAALKRVLGRPDLPVKGLPWGVLALLAPFSQTIASLRELRPYWQNAARLDNTELIAALGTEPRTPLDEALTETLRGLGIAVPQ